MILKSDDGDIDLAKVLRLYPAVEVNYEGEIAEMSLEWYELNSSKVKLVDYVLVFDFTKHGSKELDKKRFRFKSKDELIVAINEVAKYL